MEPTFRKSDNFRAIQEEITRLFIEKKKTPVIIIDEANYINNAILNNLKILFSFEMDSRDRAAVLLAGLPKLNNNLRLAVYEMRWDDDIPAGVAIDEAVELAKKYSGDDGPSFVNGVLAKLADF